jgi:hypothetical protein
MMTRDISHYRWRRVTRPSFLLGSTMAFLGALLLIGVLIPQAGSIYKDFGQEYVLARAIRDGVDPYQSVQKLGERYVTSEGYFDKLHPTPHPPTVGLLALPLSYLSYGDATRIWLLIELGCLVGFVAMAVGRQPAAFLLVVTGALALVAWPPMTLELGLAQLTMPVLLLLLAAQRAMLNGQQRTGGVLIGLTLLVKPIAWPLLLFLAIRRQWLTPAAAMVVVAVGGLVSVLAIGIDHSVDYLTRVLPMMSLMFRTEPTNIALWTLGPRLGMPWLGYLLAATALALAAWWSRNRDLQPGLAMMIVASLLVSPITWDFYLVLALLPLAHVYGVVRKRGARLLDGCLIACVLVLLSIPYDVLAVLSATVGSGIFLVPTAGLVVLGTLVAVQTQRDTDASTATVHNIPQDIHRPLNRGRPRCAVRGTRRSPRHSSSIHRDTGPDRKMTSNAPREARGPR